MIDNRQTSNQQERELSMDEILSSIRNIITEDQEVKPELRRTFPEDSTTNPSGARLMDGLPKFDQDEFVMPNFKEEDLKERKLEVQVMQSESVFPDDDVEFKHRNERSFSETTEPFYQHEQFTREASSNEDRISKTLKGIVDSYVQQNLSDSKKEEPASSYDIHHKSAERLTEIITTVLEKAMLVRVEEWLNRNLPEILEKAILRELERIINQMKL
jgi:cell pole-organizing protein PopZ